MIWLLQSSRWLQKSDFSVPGTLPMSLLECFVWLECVPIIYPCAFVHPPLLSLGEETQENAQGGRSSFSFFLSRYFEQQCESTAMRCELLTSTFAHHIYFAICTKFWEVTTRSIFKIQPFNSGSMRKYLQIGLGNQISLAHGWIPAGWAFLCVVPSPLILLIICTVYFYTSSYSLEK